MTITAHVWSDVLCPWCFLGKRRLESAIAEFAEPVEVVFHSFELDPQRRALKQPKLPAPDRLAAKYGMPVERARLMMEQMKERGSAEGIDFHLEEGRTLQSFDAHRLLHWALARGKQSEAKEALFLAHFTRALDVGDFSVLASVAKEIGLPEEEALEVLAGESFADDVRRDEAMARELGVTGVPFFVIGRYGVAGAQSKEVLLQTLDRANVDDVKDAFRVDPEGERTS